MLLGLSSPDENSIDPTNLAHGAGVEHGIDLIRLVDSSSDLNDFRKARQTVGQSMGDLAVIDAIAVIANFHMMTRIADATGTPLDNGTVNISTTIRSRLGLDSLNTKRMLLPSDTADTTILQSGINPKYVR